MWIFLFSSKVLKELLNYKDIITPLIAGLCNCFFVSSMDYKKKQTMVDFDESMTLRVRSLDFVDELDHFLDLLPVYG